LGNPKGRDYIAKGEENIKREGKEIGCDVNWIKMA